MILDQNEKDKIVSELKHELVTANKKAKEQKVEITNLSKCVMALEEKLKEVRSSQEDIENKLINNVESTSLNKDVVSKDKIISELKHELVTANKKAEGQKDEITKLTRCVKALEEKLKELRTSQADIENKLIKNNEVEGNDAISKDKKILELKHELAAGNKEVERQKTEIMNLNFCVDERLKVIMHKIDNLHMSHVEKKLSEVDEGVNISFFWNDDCEAAPRTDLITNSTKTSERHGIVPRTKVMTVNGLDYNLFNADDLFNLVSLYGHVVRVYYF